MWDRDGAGGEMAENVQKNFSFVKYNLEEGNKVDKRNLIDR